MDYSNQISPRQQFSTASSLGQGSPESSSPIRDAVSHDEQILSAVHEAISLLEKRLDTVLTPVPPQPSNTLNPDRATAPICSHLHGRMRILNEGYEDAVRRLHALSVRIEI